MYAAQSQVSDMPWTRSLYKTAKDQLTGITVSDNEAQLTIQCKFWTLETSC